MVLHFLISGSTPRNSAPLSGITIKSPPPSTTLSALAPSIFSPRYQQLITHNAKFLPTISNAICSSWVRNVQGPRLRRKLVTLSESNVSEFMNDYEGEESGLVESLSAVVQGSIWAMMQRRLFDAGAAKKLKWVSEDGFQRALHEEDPDLLGNSFMDDDEESLFQQLLDIDGDAATDEYRDELLHYFEEEGDSMLL
jgi:hypothetical protein